MAVSHSNMLNCFKLMALDKEILEVNLRQMILMVARINKSTEPRIVDLQVQTLASNKILNMIKDRHAERVQVIHGESAIRMHREM